MTGIQENMLMFVLVILSESFKACITYNSANPFCITNTIIKLST